jgi:hypothetical protein
VTWLPSLREAELQSYSKLATVFKEGKKALAYFKAKIFAQVQANPDQAMTMEELIGPRIWSLAQSGEV